MTPAPELVADHASPAAATATHVSIDIVAADEAHRTSGDARLLAAWTHLHRSCGATAFQAPAFVRTWYDCYTSRYEPVIVRGMDPRGEIVGLWFLALDRSTRELVHAGAHQAEYHAWLATREWSMRFIASAWEHLHRHFGVRRVRFKYLPDATLGEALASEPALQGKVAIQLHQRPLAKLTAEEIAASRNKKSNKSRFNRLKKLGALDFGRITDPAELDGMLDEIIDQYDFRQGAVNGVLPFRDDPLKRSFHRALFAGDRDGIDFTVTRIAGRPIAAVWAAISGTTAHLGILAFSPLLAAHSPGKLHVMQLEEHLLAHGIDVFDLTPGGDPWKERFANAHDVVAEVTLYATPNDRARDAARERTRTLVKRSLQAVHIQPSYVRHSVERLRRAGPAAVLRRVRRWQSTVAEFRVYRHERTSADSWQPDARVRVNALSDLLAFTPTETWQTRQKFLSNALERLESGQSVYTISCNGTLAHSGWMVRQRESYMTEVGQKLALPERTVTLYDYYTHPAYRGQGMYRATISHMLRDAFADPETRYVYISVLASNAPSRRVIESLGFHYQGSLHRTVRFGREAKWMDAALLAPSA